MSMSQLNKLSDEAKCTMLNMGVAADVAARALADINATLDAVGVTLRHGHGNSMTRAEADHAITERFPGRKFYVGITCWTAHGRTLPAEYSVCVYDANGDHDNNISGSGSTLRAAVESAIGKADATPAEADALLATA